MELQKLQQALERAIQAFEELERAIDEGDQRRIGSRLFELRACLQEALREAH